MKKIIFLTAFMLIICAHQKANAQIGYLVGGDTTVAFNGGNNDWIKFFLIDSTGTGDTAFVELYNPWSATWNPIVVRDDSSGNNLNKFRVPLTNKGHSYTVWLPKPGMVRLVRYYSSAYTHKLYYYFYTK